MSNYSDSNLISIPAASVPAGTLAMKVGNNIFTAGNVVISGSSMDFYKCSYVNSNSWGGYKAVQDPDTKIYSFESNSTAGLLYDQSSPEVGGIYSQDALIQVARMWKGIPQTGLVFYAPLTTNSATAETGQSLSYKNCTFTTYKGISAVRMSYACITTGILAQSGLDSGFTLSMWFCDDSFSNNSIIAHIGDWGGESGYWCGLQSNNYKPQLYYQEGVGAGSNNSLQNNTWYHVAYEQYNGTAKAWINGVEDLNTSTATTQCSGLPLYIGDIDGYSSQYPFQGYLAAVRLYNRALTTVEIAALASQFTPTA